MTSPFADYEDWSAHRRAAAAEQRGGPSYGALQAAQRLLQDRVSGAVLPAELVPEVTERLSSLAELLEEYQAPETQRWDGWRSDLPGRGLLMQPPYIVDEQHEGLWRGRVTFTRFYLGGNGAAHGGATGMLFDDLLGRVASGGREACRTASLTIDFRRITPVGVEMRFEVTLDRAEDRKRYMSARLMNPAGEVTSEATALFVVLSAGQR